MDQLSGRVPLREGLLCILLQKGDHGRERREGQQGEGERSKERKERKRKAGGLGKDLKAVLEGLFVVQGLPQVYMYRRKGPIELAGGEGSLWGRLQPRQEEGRVGSRTGQAEQAMGL